MQRRLRQLGCDGLFFDFAALGEDRLLSHSFGRGPANPAKAVLADPQFRLGSPSPTAVWVSARQACPPRMCGFGDR